MSIGLLGHHVCTQTFSNLKSKYPKDSKDFNLTQLVILVCFSVSEFIDLNLVIIVSIQRQLRKSETDKLFACLQES